MSIITVGLTGPTGAGKGAVSSVFSDYGFHIIDTDQTAREVTEKGSPCLKKLALRFGEDIILKDGSLDRRLLASRAFSTEEGKRDLNAITHPEIKKSIAQIIEVCKKDNINVLVDAPLLFEAGCDTLCDVIIAVTAPLDLRLNRIIARDNISEKQATERINAQKDDDFYIKKSHYHIINDGDINTLILKTKQIAEDCIK